MSRPILPWRSPLVLLPYGEKQVWIRRLPWYDTPVRAVTFSGADFLVTVPKTDRTAPPLVVSVPAQQVHTWKFQFLPDEQAYIAQRQPGDPR